MEHERVTTTIFEQYGKAMYDTTHKDCAIVDWICIQALSFAFISQAHKIDCYIKTNNNNYYSIPPAMEKAKTCMLPLYDSSPRESTLLRRFCAAPTPDLSHETKYSLALP
jgi:hypothetical protein